MKVNFISKHKIMFTKETYKVYKLQVVCYICQKIYEGEKRKKKNRKKSLTYSLSSIRIILILYGKKKWTTLAILGLQIHKTFIVNVA